MNTLNIPEVTLADIVKRAASVNVIGEVRVSAFDPLVVRLLGHEDDSGVAEESDPNKMALFTSRAVGHPWCKDKGTIKRITFKATDDTTACPKDATYIVPNLDYSTFS